MIWLNLSFSTKWMITGFPLSNILQSQPSSPSPSRSLYYIFTSHPTGLIDPIGPPRGSSFSCWQHALTRSRVRIPASDELWWPPLPGPSRVWEGWSRSCSSSRRPPLAHTRPQCWERGKKKFKTFQKKQQKKQIRFWTLDYGTKLTSHPQHHICVERNKVPHALKKIILNKHKIRDFLLFLPDS